MSAQLMLFGSPIEPGVLLSACPVTTNMTALNPYLASSESQASSALRPSSTVISTGFATPMLAPASHCWYCASVTDW